MPAAASTEQFNAYHQWLGLPADATSPTYYQILGLAEFESDAAKIAQAGDRAITRVRSFRPGSHAKEWSRLLDEVSSAKTCLLDRDVKQEYDRCLRSGRECKAKSPSELFGPPTVEHVKARAPLDPNRFPPGMAPPGSALAPLTEENVPQAAEVLPPVAVVESLLPPASVDSLLPAAAVPAAPLPMAMPVGYASPMMPLAMPVQPAYPASDPMAPLAAPVSIPAYAQPAYSAPAYPAATYAAPAYSPAYSAPTLVATMPAATPSVGSALPLAPLTESRPATSATSVAAILGRRRRQAQRNTLIAAVAGCLLLATGVVVYANRDKLLQLGQEQVAEANTQSGVVDTSGQSSDPLPRVVEGSLTKKPTPKPQIKSDSDTNPATPMSEPEPMPMPETKTDSADPPAPETKPESTPETKPEAAPESKPIAEPAPVPMPEPAPPPMPTKEELAALGKALAAGKAALATSDFLAADEQIAAAEALAKLPEHQEMAARLKEVAMYVKQFRHAVSEGLKALQVGAEIKVGTSTMVVVVAVTPDRLTIRRAGGNVTYPLDELPAGLTMALADSWFKADDPVNRVVKGAYFAVAEGDVQAHREKAKKYWDEAIAAGVDAKPLLPFLTDNYDLEKQAEAKPADPKPSE